VSAVNSGPVNPDKPVFEDLRDVQYLRYLQELEIKSFDQKSQELLDIQTIQNLQQLQNLRWSMVISDLQNPDNYMDTLLVARDRMMYRSFYRAYKPDPAAITRLHTLLESLHLPAKLQGSEGSEDSVGSERLKILILGATWCKICAQVKATLTNILDAVASPKFCVFFLDGAKMVSGSTIWDTEWDAASPPEIFDPQFRVRTIPTTFVFAPNGTCIGKVEKFPPNGQRFEEYLNALLEEL